MSDPTVLVPLGAHLFTSEALQQYASEALKDLPADKTTILKGGVDASGAKVVLVMSRGVGEATVSVQAAMAHDWTGNNQFGVAGQIAF